MTNELIIDLFAGGGGASEGIRRALGRCPDYALNHDADAIMMHQANHPDTVHLCDDVWTVKPLSVTRGQPVGLLWLSPDCTHHSKARGGKPVKKHIRGLAWSAVHWAKQAKPRIMILENVEEFQDWGPLDSNDKPIKARRGETFRQWVEALQSNGYAVQWREIRACDYGAPTIRKRLFIIARCDGRAIEWPEPTHGEPGNLFGLTPYRTAAECIDWSLPCPSIFERKRPLAENTLKRIAAGLRKFVIETGDPFIVGIDNQSGGHYASWSVNEPLRTITRENRFALVAPFLSKYHGQKAGESRCHGMDDPVPTVDTSNRVALVTAFISKYYGGVVGSGIDKPLPTVTAIDHNALVTAFLIKYYGCGNGQSMREPMHTVTAKDRMGLVTVAGVDYQIADIGLRMLSPRELARAQGFEDEYILTGTKSNQVARIGNSVCPDVAAALVKANMTAQQYQRVI